MVDDALGVVDDALDAVDDALDAVDNASGVVDSASGAVDSASGAVDDAAGAVDDAVGARSCHSVGPSVVRLTLDITGLFYLTHKTDCHLLQFLCYKVFLDIRYTTCSLAK